MSQTLREQHSEPLPTQSQTLREQDSANPSHQVTSTERAAFSKPFSPGHIFVRFHSPHRPLHQRTHLFSCVDYYTWYARFVSIGLENSEGLRHRSLAHLIISSVARG